MCEHYVARSEEPFALGELWDFTRLLERYGLAGWSWGVAWIDADGAIAAHRDPRPFHADEAVERLAATETTAAIVHLRRPSKLSTVGLADTQPFIDPAGRFAFSHNGDLRDHRAWRRRYQAEGRIAGRADSEVGQRWLEDRWAGGGDASACLAAMHDTFSGQANLLALGRDGAAHAYAGNTENPVFTFRLGRIGLASTGIYSLDRSLFRFVAPGATERRVVRPGQGVTLGPTGAPYAPARKAAMATT
ncbi:MAG: class II glutamine amidotransferase [Candidatus Limnocylindrales bacterium]